MQEPEMPANEVERLRALKALGVLDTARECDFDQFARLAALVCGTAYAAVSLVDSERQWFKAFEGIEDLEETSRSISFCGHAIHSSAITEIPDTHKDARFADNPLVTGFPHLRFYAGAPLLLSSGFAIGTLCALGTAPLQLSLDQREQLVLLASQVVRLLEARQLQHTRLRLSQFIERSPMMVAMLDLDAGVFSYTNDRWRAKCHQRPGDDSAGVRRMLPEVDPSLFGREKSRFQRPLLLTNTAVHFSESEITQADVQIFPDAPELDNGRFPRQLMLVIEYGADSASTRRRAHVAQQKAQLLERIACITTNPVIITDALQRIEWVNTAFERTTGYHLAEVVGNSPRFLQGPATSAEAIERINERVHAGQGVVEEVLNYAKDGSIYWLELDIQPIVDESGVLTHFVAVQTDITRRKEQEEEYRKARDEAERASQLKSQFLANVSHELRTPLNGILGISETLIQRVPPVFKADLHTLHQSGKHLLSLLNELIDLSSIEAGGLAFQHKPFCAAAVAQEVMRLFEANATAKGLSINLQLNPQATELWLLGDAKRLRQILMNLVGNAIKFSDSGGLVLSCEAVAVGPEATVQFSISDTGTGIDVANQERIFRPFEHADGVNAGAGLGLSISRQILQLMGSDLAVESTPGLGSCFYFSLQLPLAPLQAQMVHGSEAKATQRLPKQALVVDDNETNLHVMKGMLTALGVTDIHLALSGREALVAWRSLDPDVVFVDIRMPEMDGFEFLSRYISTRIPTAPVPLMVACTAFDSDADRAHFLQRGFDAHLAKPVDLSAVRELFSHARMPLQGSAELAATDSGESILQALNRKLGANVKLMRTVLTSMNVQLEPMVEKIEHAAEVGDQSALAGVIHILKGQVGYFGAEHPACVELTAIDRHLRAGDAVPRSRLQELCTLLRYLNRQVAAELAKFPAISNTNG